MANQKKEVEVTHLPQPVEELLGIAGDRTAVQFVVMLQSAFGDLKNPFRIELEYYPKSNLDDQFGPSVGYKILGMGKQFSEMLDKNGLAQANEAFE